MTAGIRNVLTTSVFDEPATPAFATAVARAGAAITILIAMVMPFRSIAIGLLPNFYTVYGIVLVAGYALSGLSLIWWSRRSRNGRAVILSAAYFFCAAIVLANVVLILDPARSRENVQGSVWLWSIWHLGLPLGVLMSTARGLVVRAGVASGIVAAVGATGAALLFTAFASRYLVVVDANRQITFTFYVACAAGMVVAVLALRRLAMRERPSALDLLLALVLLTVVGDIVLVLSSPMGFSLGTYAARIMGLMSGLIVVGTFLRWAIEFFERSDRLEQYMTIAEHAPTIMFLTNERGECIYVNERWSELTGQETPAMLGTGFHERIHPEDLPRRVGDPNWYRNANQLRFLARDGTYQWHLVRYEAVRDRSGRQIGWAGTATDLDRERRALDESRRLTEQLRRQIESEREMSTALRAAFLPSFLPDVEGIGFTGVYRPIPSSDQVGGDWYDAFVLPNGVIAFTMGDVSGHGLTAAASMLRIREGLRMTALTETSPGRVLGLQNRMLSLGGDIFATAVVAFVDPRRGRMTVAVAGHPSPVLVRRGVAEKLPVHGLVLGASEAEDFEDFRMILEPGDAVAFYTDGLIECEKAPIEGELRLLEALQDDGPERLEEMVDQLLMQGQADDATIVMLSYHLAERSVSWHFESDNADSAQSARAAFCYHLRRSGVQPDAVSRAELVFGELVGNVVRHAPGPIEINLSFQADDAVLAVRDRGHGFAQRENVLPDEPWSETGRGLFLVEAYAGSAPLVLPRRQGGTNVVATIHGAAGGGPLGAVPSVAPSVAEYA